MILPGGFPGVSNLLTISSRRAAGGVGHIFRPSQRLRAPGEAAAGPANRPPQPRGANASGAAKSTRVPSIRQDLEFRVENTATPSPPQKLPLFRATKATRPELRKQLYREHQFKDPEKWNRACKIIAATGNLVVRGYQQ